jgi:spermidine synthase
LIFLSDLFQDYGFVEGMPQRWYFFGDYPLLRLDLDEDDEGAIIASYNQDIPGGKKEREEAVQFFRRELERLYRVRNRVRNVDYETFKDGVPEQEWDTIWNYHQAAVKAMAYGLNILVNEDKKHHAVMSTGYDVSNVQDSQSNHYIDLSLGRDELVYTTQTCDNWEILKFDEYDEIETIETFHQSITFEKDQETKDICMHLDNKLQICSSFRPYYYEYLAHVPAQYLYQIERVLFVGSGNPMLLHEILEYPDIELVVGIGKDEVVTRKVFEYFGTEAHFDDDQVEWWFGDVESAIQLLPREYLASFDLVLLEQTEENSSIVKALSVFVKPEGILASNGIGIEAMGKAFNYMVRMFPESPVVCNQALVLGSNQVDFVDHPIYDHHVESRVFEPFEYLLVHDYERNENRSAAFCKGNDTSQQVAMEQERSAGVLEIVEIEDATLSFDTPVEKALSSILRGQGFMPVATHTIGSEVAVVVMEEGYVVVRMSPEHAYCGIDLFLRSQTHKLKSVRQALVDLFGDKSVSSYRRVVGKASALEDKGQKDKIREPLLSSEQEFPHEEGRNVNQEEEAIQGEILKEALQQSIDSLDLDLDSDDIMVAVVCGIQNKEPCQTLGALADHTDVNYVIPLWTCPELNATGFTSSEAAAMYECEKQTTSQLWAALGESELSMVIIDSSASLPMLQIIDSVWSSHRNRQELLKDHSIFMSLSDSPEGIIWRRNVLDRIRQHEKFDPVSLMAFSIQTSQSTIEFGILSSSGDDDSYSYDEMEETLLRRFSRLEDVKVELRAALGGILQFDFDLDPTIYKIEDYNDDNFEERDEEQHSLGRQTIFQLRIEEARVLLPSDLDLALRQVVSEMNLGGSLPRYLTRVGKGAVIVSTFSTGSAILSWEGDDRVEINLFSTDETKEHADSFLVAFSRFLKTEIGVSYRTEGPRGVGIGRVMNFRENTDLSDTVEATE